MSDEMTPARRVALLHGWAGSSRVTWGPLDWESALRAADLHACPIDLLGHGRAPAPHEPSAYDDIVAVTAKDLDRCGATDVIAFSMGAKIALRLAAERPSRFEHLVVAGVGDNVFSAENVGTVADSLEEGLTEKVPPRVRDLAAIAFASGNDLAALAACMRRRSTPLTEEQARKIAVPVLVVVGEADPIAGAPDQLMAALPDARLVRLSGIDHVGTPYARGFQESALAFLCRTPNQSAPRRHR